MVVARGPRQGEETGVALMSKRKVYGLFGVMWAAALALSVPAMAAAPTGYSEENIGPPDELGSVTVAGDKWTIKGAGNDFNGATEDQLFFVYKNVRGDGSVQARLLGPEQPNQYAGVMVRVSLDSNSAMAGTIESTSALNWIVRTAVDEAAVRTSGVSPEKYPQFMRVQRVGNRVTGFTSQDGKLWYVITPSVELAELGDTAPIGIAVSSRGSEPITVAFDNVSIQEGVVTVYGWESAANDLAALMTWQQVPTAVGYMVYRGPKGATDLSKMALLTATPQSDTSYLDTAKGDVSFKDMTYAVSAVYKGADGQNFEGPAVRIR
jgi:hypothetical protein